jgi:hypothetical protein
VAVGSPIISQEEDGRYAVYLFERPQSALCQALEIRSAELSVMFARSSLQWFLVRTNCPLQDKVLIWSSVNEPPIARYYDIKFQDSNVPFTWKCYPDWGDYDYMLDTYQSWLREEMQKLQKLIQQEEDPNR